ncbi:MAG: 50S ribosomal protein L4 [Dehalococcoidia bacterium]|nr:MAG: 50S ribosomal protein L4 [Dehalococcoidia bacterium]
MQVPVYNINGEMVKQIDIDDSIFAIPLNKAVVHQALLRQLANVRQGNASTKTRSEVAGSKQKMYRQKHTGRARAGSIRSPLRRGGGVTFGPKPKDYGQLMPKKMRQLALKCVLSAKVQEQEMMVLEEFKLDEPKTREIVKLLASLGIESSAIIATSEPLENVIKSSRNIPGITTIPARLLNVVDITRHRLLIMTENAVRQVEKIWGRKAA